MTNVEVLVVIRKLEPDGSYTEWQSKPCLSAFSAKAKREIQQMIGVTNERI